MKKKRKDNILQILAEFERTVLKQKPTLEQMVRDVSLMGFRVRPVQGEVSHFDFQNREFIKAVWSLGKLDEFYHEKAGSLSAKDKNQFSRYFESYHKKLQEELNRLNLKKEENADGASLTLEIFKGSTQRRLN